jgi:predicted DNA-binding protein
MMKKLRDHYDKGDFSEDIEQAEEVKGPLVQPYVTTSIRLPMSVMRQVRRLAAKRGAKPTVLLREWVEAAIADELGDVETTIPVTVLRSAITEYLSGKRSA